MVSSNIQPHIDFIVDELTNHPDGIADITLARLHEKYQSYLIRTGSGGKPLGPNIFLSVMRDELGADYKQCRRQEGGESVKGRYIIFDNEKLKAELTKRGVL